MYDRCGFFPSFTSLSSWVFFRGPQFRSSHCKIIGPISLPVCLLHSLTLKLNWFMLLSAPLPLTLPHVVIVFVSDVVNSKLKGLTNCLCVSCWDRATEGLHERRDNFLAPGILPGRPHNDIRVSVCWLDRWQKSHTHRCTLMHTDTPTHTRTQTNTHIHEIHSRHTHRKTPWGPWG